MTNTPGMLEKRLDTAVVTATGRGRALRGKARKIPTELAYRAGYHLASVARCASWCGCATS